MTVDFNGRKYAFRICDTKGKTRREVQDMANERGRMQYEAHGTWLVIPGIGYGWEVIEEEEA